MQNRVRLEQIRREVIEKLVGRVLPVRLVAAPLGFLVVAIAFVGDHEPWRVGALVLVAAVAFANSAWEYLRFRRQGLSWNLVPFGAFLGALLGLTTSLLTGGIESPLVAAFAPVTLVFSLLTSTRLALSIAALLLTGVWIFTLAAIHGWFPWMVPARFGGGASAGHPDALLIAWAVLLTFLVPWAATLGGVLRRTFNSMVTSALDAREETIRAHAEHTRALTSLSGEIAHELKNPLASIRSLAALMAKDAEGKSAERLAVLRSEVERMHTTLEEFLNLSRPLVPLNVREVDLRDVVTSAISVHEGMAREAQVTLTLSGQVRLTAACDARKVTQVLINLIQNAIQASPRGAAVEVALIASPGQVRIEVRDRGPGVPPDVRDKLFEPGVTTKERGTGFGLAIARGLARQHGGEVTLEARDGGGSVGVLSLPCPPALQARPLSA